MRIPRGEPAKEEAHMKLLPIATAAAALAIVTVAVAQQATVMPPMNKADCEKAKMKWDEKGGKDGKGACVATAPAAQPPKK
jgi:hypothetical protein